MHESVATPVPPPSRTGSPLPAGRAGQGTPPFPDAAVTVAE
jgi:hypothetical protein